MLQPTVGTRILRMQKLAIWVQVLLVRLRTTTSTILLPTNLLHWCLEINYLSTTNMDNASQAATCKQQATTAPRAPTPSTASYISTPGPVLHDISHVYCEELSDHYCSNPLEVNYNQQINPEDVCENYLRATSSIGDYWWILVLTLVLRQGTLPLRYYWNQYYSLFSYFQLRQHLSRSTGQREYYWFLESCLSMFVSTSQM